MAKIARPDSNFVIEIGTRLTRLLKQGNSREKYDAWACRILGEPRIIAFIAKCCIPQLRQLSLDEIIDLIDGLIQIDCHPVFAEDPYLSSTTVVSKSAKEGTTLFDVVATIRLPGSERRARVIINLEAQTDVPSWEWMSGRIEAYLARLISMQFGNNVTAEKYDCLEEVYSIWLFPTPESRYVRNRAIRLQMGERADDLAARAENEVQKAIAEAFENADKTDDGLLEKVQQAARLAVKDAVFPEDAKNWDTRFRERYRLRPAHMNAVLLFLGRPNETDDNLLRFADIIFDSEMLADTKVALLENEYGIIKNIKVVEKGLDAMGSLSAALIRNVTADVTRQVTADVTRQVTADVTRQVTADVTHEVEAKIARQLAQEALTAGRSLEDTAEWLQNLCPEVPAGEITDILAAAKKADSSNNF